MSELFQIGEACHELKLTPRTCRFWEQRGLVRPQRAGSAGQVRLYDEETMARLREIKRLTGYGFTLSEIKKGVTTRDMIRQHGELRQKIVEMEAAAVEMARALDAREDGSYG